MQKHGQGAPHASGLQLVLFVLAVWVGISTAAYLCWTVHWVAAVVIVVYLWMLLTDVFVTGRQSTTWYLLDFLHHLISFAGTAIIASYLWRIDWRIGTIAILPVLILLLTLTGYVILHLYAMTPEGHAAQEAEKQLQEQDQMTLV